MIVDCHTHINTGDSADSASLDQLVSVETVEKCIVLAEPGGDSEQVNKTVAENISSYKEKMIGFAFADPTKDNIRLKNVKSNIEKLGFKGIALYCSVCGFHPAHSRAMRFYEAAQELSLPIFFHNAGMC